MWHNSASGFGGISNYFQERNLKHFSPTPLPSHSSAYYKAYWASSMSSIPSYNSKGLIIIMQFLKQKAKKRNPPNDMKKCPNYQEKKIHRDECMKEWSRTELGAGHQSTSWESVIWLATRPLFYVFVFFLMFFMLVGSVRRGPPKRPQYPLPLEGLYWPAEDGSLGAREFHEFKQICGLAVLSTVRTASKQL